MNYYRRYVGSYLKKTTKLSMLEDGAYTRLLDTYYADEKALVPTEAYTIARAMTAAERKAVDSVVEKHFYVGEDGLLHNPRADEELGIAVPKIEKLRENARENGKKGGRPKTKTGSEGKPELVTESKPDLVPNGKQPSAFSRQPESKPPSEKRIPGGDTTPDSAAAFGAAALKNLQPPGPEANVSAENETPAGMLAAVCQRNGITANAFHPLVVEWARCGFTVENLRAAIATARQPQRKGEGTIPLAYLDPILHDASKPRAKPWKSDDAEAERLCRELGIKGSKIGEQRDEWHARIERALAENSRQRVA